LPKPIGFCSYLQFYGLYISFRQTAPIADKLCDYRSKMLGTRIEQSFSLPSATTYSVGNPTILLLRVEKLNIYGMKT